MIVRKSEEVTMVEQLIDQVRRVDVVFQDQARALQNYYFAERNRRQKQFLESIAHLPTDERKKRMKNTFCYLSLTVAVEKGVLRIRWKRRHKHPTAGWKYKHIEAGSEGKLYPLPILFKYAREIEVDLVQHAELQARRIRQAWHRVNEAYKIIWPVKEQIVATWNDVDWSDVSHREGKDP
jgi:hypothetical protein